MEGSCSVANAPNTVSIGCMRPHLAPLRSHRHTTWIPVILVVAGLFTAACQPRQTAVEAGLADQVLHLGNGAEPESLDPHITTGFPEYKILNTLFEGLVAPDPRDLSPTPGAAASWDISEDGTRYVFHLQPEGRWSNGDPVTAGDFVTSFQRALSPRLGNRYTYLYDPIVNARAFAEAELDDFSLVGIQEIDRLTLEIRLTEPVPYFLSLLTHNAFYPVHPPTILAHGDLDERATRWIRPGVLVGNGPFRLTEWRTNSFLRVERNPHYWDAETVGLNAVVFYPIENQDTEERAYRSGQIHATSSLPRATVARLSETGAPEFRADPFVGVYYFTLNTTRPPLDDVRVRRALALAIDRDNIVATVTRGGETPARHFIPDSTAGYRPGPLLGEDVAEARRLLAEAGFPDGRGFPTLELLFNTLESHREIAQVLQQMWRETLGINIRLFNQEWQVYLATRRSGNFDVSRAGWVASYNDPTVFTNLLISDAGNNDTGWANDEYDRLAVRARHTIDPGERLALFHRMEEILLKEMPVIPLYFYRSHYLLHPAVRNWHPTPLNQHPLKHVYLDPGSQ